MVQQLLAALAPMLLGAQLLVTLILIKGELCPGQRGRIHKMLPVFAILWLAVASIHIEAMMMAFALAYFYSQVQTKKTRVQGPLWVMHVANGLALVYIGIEMTKKPDIVAGINTGIQVVLLGAVFAHLLLTVARTRLQAFHRLLPATGVVSTMLICLTVLYKSLELSEPALIEVGESVLLSFVLSIAAILIWCAHIILSKPVHKLSLTAAVIMLLLATTMNQVLFIV
ncbi:hypothetical protein ACFFUP_01270 [Vibrio ostreicida]|uniref:Uncharacterized protein n=1 Tax=Vibrio ostreicida TaxID=526588 RepID=A0ABT8BV51_9VIBR|nr:hypothetical protein [Vibrio ostreicida]MDN3610309.1 hypothetical protein [Vibrio ostreicida]NPD07677.1 hypothetical protein [Vibrio ostreicida]